MLRYRFTMQCYTISYLTLYYVILYYTILILYYTIYYTTVLYYSTILYYTITQNCYVTLWHVTEFACEVSILCYKIMTQSLNVSIMIKSLIAIRNLWFKVWMFQLWFITLWLIVCIIHNCNHQLWQFAIPNFSIMQ